MKKVGHWSAIAGVSLAMLGCTTLQPLSLDSGTLRNSLHPGDHVQLTTTTGQNVNMTVESLDDQGLHGSGRTVRYGDISSIDRKETSAGRTALAVLGVVAVGAALASGGSGGGGY
ncbi:MAG TPA: hypothetical protein VKB34_22790 [Povalibacter sp.]|nr:hypothetical protein [Povalibacter sp.]